MTDPTTRRPTKHFGCVWPGQPLGDDLPGTVPGIMKIPDLWERDWRTPGVICWNTTCMSRAKSASFCMFLEYESSGNPHGCSFDPRPVTPGVAGSSPVHSANILDSQCRSLTRIGFFNFYLPFRTACHVTAQGSWGNVPLRQTETQTVFFRYAFAGALGVFH